MEGGCGQISGCKGTKLDATISAACGGPGAETYNSEVSRHAETQLGKEVHVSACKDNLMFAWNACLDKN